MLRGPYRATGSNVPMNTAVRMHENRVAIDTWDTLGAKIVTLPRTEAYRSGSWSTKAP
ncbi:hypothetical protein C357_17650 [Citreicella sp. 357]|nr:hypothetical protein C357_17650 [Citreicella sp. 357]